MVLYGDVPLIQLKTLEKIIEDRHALTLLTQFLDNPKGYGRIVRDLDGKICRIVEEKDATPEQRQIREINTGVLAAPTALLRIWLSQLGNENAQGEYYLSLIHI